jgi:hypothetical protein
MAPKAPPHATNKRSGNKAVSLANARHSTTYTGQNSIQMKFHAKNIIIRRNDNEKTINYGFY